MIKMQPEMSEQMKINNTHSLLRKNAKTFRNISTANRQTREDVLVIFRRKNVKPESQATAKHKWHRLVLDTNTRKLPDFLEELNQGGEKAFGDDAQKMIGSLLYAKPLCRPNSKDQSTCANWKTAHVMKYLLTWKESLSLTPFCEDWA